MERERYALFLTACEISEVSISKTKVNAFMVCYQLHCLCHKSLVLNFCKGKTSFGNIKFNE
jgi:hypothetical protein